MNRFKTEKSFVRGTSILWDKKVIRMTTPVVQNVDLLLGTAEANNYSIGTVD